jgi:hypothetical protein
MNYKKDTYKLLKIVKKYNFLKEIKKIPKLSKNIFLMNIYKKLKKIYSETYIQINKIHIQENNINKSDLSENKLNNNFTSLEIKNDIIQNLKYNYQLTYENIIINYYSKKSFKKIPNLIIIIFKITKVLMIFFGMNKKQIINYFETDNKKEFPKSNKILSPNEVNSGVTCFGENNEISLFRKEEIIKVLIHELIHSNLIDHKIIFSKLSKKFNDSFCVDYDILLNEAYAETIANIFNLFFINIINKCTKKDLDKMFDNELKYSIYIYSKIMNYYKIDDINKIIKDNNGKCNLIFPQKTNVFSYYFIKSILLMKHIELFKNNDLKIKDDKTINDMIKLININLLNKFIIKIKDRNKSLRLTLYELENI